jgi:hypothetical protein
MTDRAALVERMAEAIRALGRDANPGRAAVAALRVVEEQLGLIGERDVRLLWAGGSVCESCSHKLCTNVRVLRADLRAVAEVLDRRVKAGMHRPDCGIIGRCTCDVRGKIGPADALAKEVLASPGVRAAREEPK